MNKEIKDRRHGDVNLISISEREYEAVQGKTVSHSGSFILARGEATGSKHVLEVARPSQLEIKVDAEGRHYFAISGKGTITHTHDHETITTPKEGYYIQVPEREMDHFADSVVRKVID